VASPVVVAVNNSIVRNIKRTFGVVRWDQCCHRVKNRPGKLGYGAQAA
jgi:hypothetical protein